MIILDSKYTQFRAQQAQVADMWKRYVNEGSMDQRLLPPVIVSSWKRSSEFKVDPLMQELELSIAPDFQERLSAKEQLLDVAIPYLTKFLKIAEQSDFVFSILDERGLLLKVFGNKDRVKRLKEEYNISPGVTCCEQTMGTTALYLSLLTNSAVQTVGAEHFIRKYHNLTDSAAPIHDASGKVIGALDMSAQSIDYAHPHTLGMATSAANAIETLLWRQKEKQYLELLSACQENIIDCLIEMGFLAVDSTGTIVEANSLGAKLLGFAPHEIRGMKIDAVSPRSAVFNKGLKQRQEQKGKTAETIVSFKEPGLEEKEANESALNAKTSFSSIIGYNKNFLAAIYLAKKAANSTSAVLLLGESGTGKELVAQAIHNEGLMSKGPFISVNCAAIPKDLVGTELFGYEEGAFTGAKKSGNAGKFELAHNGTIFLDEIGEMPLEMQTILLRVLEEKKITRIGGNSGIPVNVRIIAATNRKLREDALAGLFRRDLFFRLNVFTVDLPPLRERHDDIPLLVNHFVLRFAHLTGKNIEGVTAEAMEALCQYNWPGNVRELSNAVERALHFTDNSCIDVYDLPEEIVPGNHKNEEALEEALTVKNYEKEKILEFLTLFQGNKTKVATKLGISRATLYRRLGEFGML